MELHQLRYLVRVAELGSIKAVARELNVVPSAVSRQLSLLEEEFGTSLLSRHPAGVTLTDAGMAMSAQARLALRHVDSAVSAARDARFSGMVGVGMAATTAALLAKPFAMAMQERYPDIRLHLVEALAGHLHDMLRDRRLDLAVLYQMDVGSQWSVTPILSETLFLIARRGLLAVSEGDHVQVSDLARLPLILTSKSHGLRRLVDAAFQRAGVEPVVGMEVDGLPTLMSIVRQGQYATIQPGAAVVATGDHELCAYPMADPLLRRTNLITSVSDDELSPAALAARVVLGDLMRGLVSSGSWPGARLHDK